MGKACLKAGLPDGEDREVPINRWRAEALEPQQVLAASADRVAGGAAQSLPAPNGFTAIGPDGDTTIHVLG